MYLIVERETGEILADFIIKNTWCMNMALAFFKIRFSSSSWAFLFCNS